MEKLSLPPKLVKFVEQKVSEGLYKDQSEVISEGLRELMEKEIFGRRDITESVFTRLMMLTKDMDDDLRLIMAEIRTFTAAKMRLREIINDLNDWISVEIDKCSGSSKVSHDISNEPVQRNINTDKREILVSKVDSLNANLDYLDQVSEINSLHLQIIVERFSTLSQLYHEPSKSSPRPKRDRSRKSGGQEKTKHDTAKNMINNIR